MGHASYIDTIDGKNLDELMPNYLNSEIPVILKGAASEWPALQNHPHASPAIQKVFLECD